MAGFSFDEAVSKLRATPRGKEASMYGPLRDLFIHVLGYPASDVDIDTTGEGGRPDVTVRAPSGLLDGKGRVAKIDWIVVEAKDERGCFANAASRESIFEKKAKYVGSHTAYFVMVEPDAWVVRPVAGMVLSAEGDQVIELDGLTETVFRERLHALQAQMGGISIQLERFRAGDLSMIGIEKLDAPDPNSSKTVQNRIRLSRKRFFQQVRDATSHLQQAVAVALKRCGPELERYRQAGHAFGQEFGECAPKFDGHTLWISASPEGPDASRRHDREASRLRREFAKAPHLARLALQGLPDFQARTGVEDNKLTELFAIETANLILARVLLLRFFEDHGFFEETRYVCNGGVEAFQKTRTYFKSSYAKLLEHAYQAGSRLYASAFDETELDWIFGVNDETLSSAIEWTLFRFARYDFTTVKGDILTGIYDRFMDRAQRKKLGEFYTPPSIARYMIKRLGITRDSRVLDPACGSGTFLIESYREMVGRDVDRGAAEYADVLETLDRIAGNDLNTFSAVLAQIQLLWQLLGLKNDIDREGFPDVLVTAKVNSLVERDHWTVLDRFAEIDRADYDAVIGNPPYVRAERSAQALDRRSQLEFERGRLGFAGVSPKINAFALFLYRALDRWCKPASEGVAAGRVAFVLPVTLFDGNEFADLRRLFMLGQRWTIVEVIDLEVIYKKVFDADVLPAIFIAENRPARSEDMVSIRFADHSCVHHREGDALAEFNFDALALQSIPYADLFSPDGRILTRLTPTRLAVLRKLWAQPTLEVAAKAYWVRKQGSRIVEWVDHDPGNAEKWELRRMVAGGIAFRGSRVEKTDGHDVYKGENIVAAELQGEPAMASVALGAADDRSLWAYESLLPERGYALAQVAHSPNACSFNSKKQAFTNTATLFFPREDLAGVPFDLLLLSNVYVWFHALAARMGILRQLRSHIYPTNLKFLPWSEGLVEQAARLEALRQPLKEACAARMHSEAALKVALAELNLLTLKQRLLKDPEARASWGDNFDLPDYEVAIGEVSIKETDDGWAVNLSPDLYDWLEVSNEDFALGMKVALGQQRGMSLSKSELLNLAIPCGDADVARWEKTVEAHGEAQLTAQMQARLAELDGIVGSALGLSEGDLVEIRRDLMVDPFLQGVRPRYPGTVTRKQGFRTGLDAEDRYE